MIVGIDEAGRGALCGPISVGLSLVPKTFPHFTWRYLQESQLNTNQDYSHQQKDIDDSKSLSELKREQIYNTFKSQIQTKVLFISPKMIDAYGLSSGIKAAIAIALTQWVLMSKLDQTSEVYLDGSLYLPKEIDSEVLLEVCKDNQIESEVVRFLQSKSNSLFERVVDTSWLIDYFFKTETVIKGDAKVLAIAAASIAAKIKRDEVMVRLSKKFKAYQWNKNKGYATKLHRQKILENGVTEHHRVSFLKNLVALN